MARPPALRYCNGRARSRADVNPGSSVGVREGDGEPPDRSGGIPPDPNDALRRPGLVPEAGLEPAWVSPHAPQTCVSANSTTPAAGWIELLILESAPGSVKRLAPSVG